jgi:type VI secretion system protein ImpL
MGWVKLGLVLIGFLAFSAVVFFAGPLIGFGDARPFDPLWVRLTIIGVLALILLVWGLIKFLRRNKGQKALEKALIADAPPTGDGRELAMRMTDALGTLKKTGGKHYLYDLPWYVIIGPPGSGKTTALVNSEIKFPVAGNAQGGLQGFGGTRYCDWWFAEDAVLIDTAGRYTTQDSDAGNDKASWSSFLNLLKKNRPKQPINGVILAFSVADLMRAEPDAIQKHAETVRARLGEIHEALKVDFPVYVVFTKADLIAGFREYFASFPAARRKRVWGTTFQTKSQREQTWDRVPAEYDALVSRLSEEVIDRMSEEPDGVNRIAIFGLPGQLAEMKDEVALFLRLVFEPTRYASSAILRGFYFTSGTQEGTPIDQVLGAMTRSFGGQASGQASGLMSGKGKSFFLHDLLTKVIFAEQGWVSYDRKAVRRSSVLRMVATSAMVLASFGLLGAWAWSYYNNRQLVASAEAAMSDYELAADADLKAAEVSDTDLLRVGNELQILRTMPSGYDSAEVDESGWDLGFGLSQQGAIRQAARDAYAQGLERLFRPRLVLRVEERLQTLIAGNETLGIYETLKVYKALGGAAPVPQDEFVQNWFKQDWEQITYPGINNEDARKMLDGHLTAMLDLDDTTTPAVTLNGDLVEKAEIILGRMSVEEQAYSLIKASAPYAGIPDFNLVERLGPDARLVFETVDGSDLSVLGVPALYTYNGFHNFFLDQLAAVAQKIESEQWVMGKQAEVANIDAQLTALGPTLLRRYREDYITAWEGMLDNLKLAPLVADKPTYQALSAISSSATSPLLKLVEAVSGETKLTAAPAAPEDPAGKVGDAIGNAGEAISDAQSSVEAMVTSRVSGLQRIGLDLALAAGKSQARAGAAGSGGSIVPGQDIEVNFQDYQQLLDGTPGSRPIDALLKSFDGIYQALIVAASGGQAQVDAAMPRLMGELKATVSRLPAPLQTMINKAVEDIEGSNTSSTISQINEAMNNQVVPACKSVVEGRYPFSNNPSRQVPLSEFAQLFAPGGVLDNFFNTNLAVHANMGAGDWSWMPDDPIADKASLQTLRQFQRAAEIRDAFFPGRNPTVSLDVTVIQTQAHDRVRQSILSIDGQTVQMRQKGNTPQTVKWPGGAGATVLQLLPELGNRESAKQWQGPWSFMQFIREGSPRQVGDILQVTHIIGGRNISYDIRVNALKNPFNLAALREFRCPSGL